MFRNFFLISWRKAKRQKTYTLINIFGMAIGMAAFILISLYVRYELSYDRDVPGYRNIYRVCGITHHAQNKNYESCTPFPMARALRLDLPDYPIMQIYNRYIEDVFIGEKSFREENLLYVDSLFEEFFPLQWVQGNPETALHEAGNVVLTDSLAQKYFGNENPLGKRLEVGRGRNMMVSGVVATQKVNSSMPYSMILPFEALPDSLGGMAIKRWDLTMSGMNTFIKLGKNIDSEMITKAITASVNKNYHRHRNEMTYELQPLSQMHFQSKYVDIPNNYAVKRSVLNNLIWIGLLILLAACFNFINLSTAQLVRRSKEAGMRRVLGSGRKGIIAGFISETSVIVLISIVFGLIISEILLPVFNRLIMPKGEVSIYDDPAILLILLAVWIVASLLTGLYPGWMISRFAPVDCLKNNLRSGGQKRFTLRKVLIIMQFTITTALVINVLTISRQISYVHSKDLGFEKENTLIFQLPGNSTEDQNHLYAELSQNPQIRNVSISLGAPSSSTNMGTHFHMGDESKNDDFQIYLKLVDTAYKNAFGLKVLHGRWLYYQHEDDSIHEVLVNETFLKKAGMAIGDETIGEIIGISMFKARIVGIVNDFHSSSLRSEIRPIAFLHMPFFADKLIVKHYPGQAKQVNESVTQLLEEMFPAFIISSESLEDYLSLYYEDDQRMQYIILSFMLVAVIIAILGIYGIISFVLAQQIRSIGIRKTFGASVFQIIYTYTREYIMLVVLANLIAWPFAYYFSMRWLESFEFRIAIPWSIYVISLLASIAITYLSIGYQSYKAAQANPADALRFE